MPGRPRRTELSEDMWRSLKLVEDGEINIGEICKEMGWDPKYFYNLRVGNVEKAGSIATLFSEEFKKAEEKRDKETRLMLKQNIATAQKLLTRILKDYSGQKKIEREDKKLIGTLTNCLNNCTPSVTIKSTSFNYVQGLNPQDLISEFKRLKGIAESSFNRERVSAASAGGSGRLPEIDEQGM